MDVLPTFATTGSLRFMLNTSLMPQRPKAAIKAKKRTLMTQDEALERMNWSMTTRCPRAGAGPNTARRAARGRIIGSDSAPGKEMGCPAAAMRRGWQQDRK